MQKYILRAKFTKTLNFPITAKDFEDAVKQAVRWQSLLKADDHNIFAEVLCEYIGEEDPTTPQRG